MVQLRCIFYGLVEKCELEGVELCWTWIGKMMAVVC